MESPSSHRGDAEANNYISLTASSLNMVSFGGDDDDSSGMQLSSQASTVDLTLRVVYGYIMNSGSE